MGGTALSGIRTLSLSVASMVVVVYIFLWLISEDIPQGYSKTNEQHGNNEVKGETNKKNSREKRGHSSSSREDHFDPREDLLTEVHLEDGRRFKLFEKKLLNHKKAKSFCKKREGKLAEAKNINEMQRLQMLLMRAKMIGEGMWVGADKKEWKRHSQRMQAPRPDFGPNLMMAGGGVIEMCPALSSSTRSLFPVECTNKLAFICEFEKGKGKLKVEKNSKVKSKSSINNMNMNTKKMKKPQQGKYPYSYKEEMKRKRRQITQDHTILPIDMPSTVETPMMMVATENAIKTATTTTNDSLTLTNSTDDEADDNQDQEERLLVTESEKELATDRIIGHDLGFTPHVIQMVMGDNNIINKIKEKGDFEKLDMDMDSSSSNTNQVQGHYDENLMDTKTTKSLDLRRFSLASQEEIEGESKNLVSEMKMPVGNQDDQEIEMGKNPEGESYDGFSIKLSAKVLVAREASNTDQDQEQQKMITMTSGHNKVETTTTYLDDPDQILMNLIDEQTENMRLIDFASDSEVSSSSSAATVTANNSEGQYKYSSESQTETAQSELEYPSSTYSTEQIGPDSEKSVRKRPNSKRMRHGVPFNLPEASSSAMTDTDTKEYENENMMKLGKKRLTLLRPLDAKNIQDMSQNILLDEQEMSSTYSSILEESNSSPEPESIISSTENIPVNEDEMKIQSIEEQKESTADPEPETFNLRQKKSIKSPSSNVFLPLSINNLIGGGLINFLR